MTDRARILALVVLSAGLAVPLPAAAQEIFIDRFGNRYEVLPPPVWRDPPPVRRRLPSTYVEPGPYDAPPPDSWGRLPPADIPNMPPSRRRLPGGYVEPIPQPDYSVEVDPDALPLPGDDPRLVDPRYDPRFDPRYRDGQPIARNRLPDDPALAPPPDRDLLAPPPVPVEPGLAGRAGRTEQAIDAIARYATAKKDAVGRNDPFERLKAIRSVNAYLVGQSVRPATAESIAAIDKLLGIPVSPESVALPGAGTELATPKGGGDAAKDVRRLLRDYAGVKVEVAAAGGSAATAEVTAAARAILTEAGKELTDAEIAGLDAFLGVGVEGADVAARPADPAPADRIQ